MFEAIWAIFSAIGEALIAKAFVVKKKLGWRLSEEEKKTEHMRQ